VVDEVGLGHGLVPEETLGFVLATAGELSQTVQVKVVDLFAHRSLGKLGIARGRDRHAVSAAHDGFRAIEVEDEAAWICMKLFGALVSWTSPRPWLHHQPSSNKLAPQWLCQGCR
jgi:hypothetical protein